MQVQQGLVLALAHCLSISCNAALQQQILDEILKDLTPAFQHLQSMHQSPGTVLTLVACFQSCILGICTCAEPSRGEDCRCSRNTDASDVTQMDASSRAYQQKNPQRYFIGRFGGACIAAGAGRSQLSRCVSLRQAEGIPAPGRQLPWPGRGSG
jgi:hypothetical protein